MKKLASVLLLASLATSCTTAGPFVTSISSDGRGNLIVEKCHVKMNAFMGTVSNEDTTTSSIKIVDLEKLQQIMDAGPRTASPKVFE